MQASSSTSRPRPLPQSLTLQVPIGATPITCERMCACMHACLRVCACVNRAECVHVCVHVCVHMCMYVGCGASRMCEQWYQCKQGSTHTGAA